MTAPSASVRPSRGRLRLFRILLVLLVLVVPAVLLEALLRLSGYGYDPGFLRPATVGGRPCLVDNPQFGRRFFPERLARVPQPLVVEVPKPAGTLRVVVLGESAALGDPEPAYGLPRMLEVLLEQRLPGTRVEVVNAAMTAINSHALRDIARDCVALEADAWVVYAGNNEVVGPYGPGTVFGRAGGSLPLIRAGLALRRTRTGQLLDEMIGRLTFRGKTPAGWAGLGMFQSREVAATDPRLADVGANFRTNLDALLDTARGAGIPVVLGTVAGNLRDFAPLSVTNAPAATRVEAEVARWPSDAEPAGMEALYRDPDRTRAGSDAALAYQVAEVMAVQGRTNLAVAGWLAARDLDGLRFRADTRLVNVIREAAADRAGVRLVDVELELARRAGGAPGAEFFWEHVHFNPRGNHALATLLGDGLLALLPGDRTAGARPAWVDEETATRALALTDWDRRRLIQLVRSRLAAPPFATQLNAVAREQRLAGQVQELGSALQAGAFEPAAAMYRAAMQARPDDWRLHAQFAGLLAGFRDVEGAREEWEAVLQAVPDHLLAHYQLGTLLGDAAATNAPAAEHHLRAALAMRRDFAEAWQQLGRVLAKQERFAEADEAYLQALANRPELTDARVDRAITFQVAGRTNEAIAVLREALKADPGHPGAPQVLGRTLMALGRPAEAAEVWENVARLRPDNFAGRLQLADAWQQAGRLDRSGPHLVTALKMNPDHIQTRFRLAMQYAQAGMHELASEQFREVIQREPRAVSAWLNLGSSLMGERKVPEALTAFEKVLELEPANGQAREYARQARTMLGTPSP